MKTGADHRFGDAAAVLLLAAAVHLSPLGSGVVEPLEAQVAVDSAGVEIVQAGPAEDGWEVAGQCVVLGDVPSLQIGSLAGEESALQEVDLGVEYVQKYDLSEVCEAL